MALFQTTEELKSYLSAIQKNLEMSTVLSFVEDAELLYIQLVLGQQLYDKLTQDYLSNSLSHDYVFLLKKVQRPLAHFTFYQYAQLGNVFASDLGFQQSATDNTRPAPESVMNKIINFTCQTADSFLSQLISFLEVNTSKYPEFLTSDFYLNRNIFLSSSTEFQKRYPIANSALGFFHLTAYIRLAQDNHIINEIGDAFFQDISAKILTNELSDPEKPVVELIKNALAQFTIYEALPGLSLDISPSSIRATVFMDDTKTIKPADIEIMKEIKEQAKKNGQAYLNRLKKTLDATPDLFPAYQNSEKYQPPPAVKSYNPIDNCGSTIFYMK